MIVTGTDDFIDSHLVDEVLVRCGCEMVFHVAAGIRASASRFIEGPPYPVRQKGNQVVCSTPKVAVSGLTRQPSADWAAAGIRFNALVAAGFESGPNETSKRRYAIRETVVDGDLSTW